MSFLFALSPFKSLSPSSPPTSTTPQDRIEGQGSIRRELPRNHPNCTNNASSEGFPAPGLASPFKTPIKPTPPPPASRGSPLDGSPREEAESSSMALQRADRSTSRLTTDSGHEGDDLAEDILEADGVSQKRILPTGGRGKRIDFLTHLPHEVALLIVLHLPTHRCLLDVGSVSTSWRRIANDSLVWRDFFHRNPGWLLKKDEEVEVYLAALEDEELLLPADREIQCDFTYNQLSRLDLTNGSDRVQYLSTPTKASQSIRRNLLSAASKTPSSSSKTQSPISCVAMTPGQQRYESQRESTTVAPERLVDRLDWRRVYSARYRLASRFGEVSSVTTPQSQRSKDKEEVKSKRRQFQARNVREDWEDDDDDESGLHSDEYESEGSENTDDEETIARRQAEAESLVAASTHSSTSRRRQSTRLANGESSSSSSGRHNRSALRPQVSSIRTMGAHEDYIYCLRIFPSYQPHSPCQGYFVTGSKDHTIRVFEIRTGKCLHVLKGHTGSVLALDMDEAGDILVSGSSDHMLGIWSWFGCKEALAAAKEGRPWSPTLLDRWDCHVPVMDVRLTSWYLVLGLKNGQVRAYTRHPTDRSEFKRCSVYKQHHCSLNDMKVQGHFVAAGFALGATELIDLRTGESVRRFIHYKGVACIEYDGDILVAGASDGVIRCWRASTGQLLLVLSGHEQLPRSLFFDYNRGLLISVGYDGIINLWDVTLLIDAHLVEGSALGDSWNCLAVQMGQQKRWIEEAMERRGKEMDRIRERVYNNSEDRGMRMMIESGGGGDGGSSSSVAVAPTVGKSGVAGSSPPRSPPPPHPLAHPPRPYKPRSSTRQRQLPSIASPLNNDVRTNHGAGAGAGVGAGVGGGENRAIQGVDNLVAPPRVESSHHSNDHDHNHNQPQLQLQPQRQHHHPANPTSTSSTSSASSSIAIQTNPCRLFDVAFDGKRIMTVGDLRQVSIYEFLPDFEEDVDDVDEEKEEGEKGEDVKEKKKKKNKEGGKIHSSWDARRFTRDWLGWEIFR